MQQTGEGSGKEFFDLRRWQPLSLWQRPLLLWNTIIWDRIMGRKEERKRGRK
jgi:hypothetical protein